MASQAFYLKYRPQTFEQVAGQEPITRTLRNALRQDRLRHAYLFAGPRGTGKTTMARLLAKAANCEAVLEERPCNVCARCQAINDGRFLDLIEIDAASNRGIDEIRDIREKVGFRPNEGRFKVYVLDEAHMLTEPAFNALLKTLEEPPPHVLFALVTTEAHKIPATIVSRCQRFDFRRIPLQAIVDRLAEIAGAEGLTTEPLALELIARQGTGALRDAISLLDQLASYGDEVRADQVQMVLGTVAGQAAVGLVQSLVAGDVAGGLDLINGAVGDGADPRQLSREVVEYLRGLLLIQEGAAGRLLNATAEQAAEMEALAPQISLERVLQAIRLFSESATELRRGLQTIPQLSVELAFLESTLTGRRRSGDGAQGSPAVSAPGRMGAHAEQGPDRPLEHPTPTAPPVKVEGSSVGQTAEQMAEGPAASGAAEGGLSSRVATEPAQTYDTGSGEVSLTEVRQAWERVLLAVRQRNPTAEAALRTSCEPVEVNGNELLLSYPFPFLREKLGTPQRQAEIEEALSEVMGRRCRVGLVYGPEYKPGQRAAEVPGPEVSEGRKPGPEEPSLGQGLLGEQALDQISRWAEERGGRTTIIQP